ncbi:class I SAM-dependent methyltransferase [Ensifer sp. ENS03]|uniref:class I SAM-dependent methyltransferase n=1 Tax=Ensifer sp. ENS03 TaxID=2769283 RepID=UPI00177A9E00|nr:class I SAM-dependent methyltransferase [Ensifer sp. ENS03]MBD9559609.1 class I SAM-dependent methyltransferase [Ensifer sp. ENS03]
MEDGEQVPAKIAEEPYDEVKAVRAELDTAYRFIDGITAKIKEGKIVEFEYGHLTKKRNYANLPNIKRDLEWFEGHEQKYFRMLLDFSPYFSLAMEIEDQADISTNPSWRNPWFPFVDAISTYCLIAANKPKRYIEVGSGFSTKFARRAIKDFSPDTKLISIDPYPRDEINEICDEVMRFPFQDVDRSFFDGFTADDIFFFDSSHRVDQGGDVAVFFGEILPNLPKGMLYGIHDIFYPDEDYPESWLPRHYSEQYMLMAYLSGGGGGDEIVFPAYYVSQRPRVYEPLQPLLQHDNIKPATGRILGQSFWMRKG